MSNDFLELQHHQMEKEVDDLLWNANSYINSILLSYHVNDLSLLRDLEPVLRNLAQAIAIINPVQIPATK